MASEAETSHGSFPANATSDDIKQLLEAHANQAKEMEALRATLAKMEKNAAATAVPGSMPSSSSGSNVPPKQESAVPQDLQGLALDWGDFDPEFRRRLFTDDAFRAEFVKFHSTDHTEVRVIHESQIMTNDDYHRKRNRTEISTPAAIQSVTDDESLGKAFLQWQG